MYMYLSYNLRPWLLSLYLQLNNSSTITIYHSRISAILRDGSYPVCQFPQGFPAIYFCLFSAGFHR